MKKLDTVSIFKAFSPKLLVKVVQAFDKATIILVGSCWAAALVTMMFSLYALSIASNTKRDVATAIATEPAVPKMVTKSLDQADLQPLSDRMQKRFSEITFGVSGDTLTVTANEPGKFRQWLTVLSYIDTISPQYRWTIKEFCVGMRCGGSTPMKAVIQAEKISFTTS